MTQPVKLNLKIYQGSTFLQTLRWESSTKVYVPITNITKSAPVVITAASHNIPVGWRARITNVIGMKEINCSEDEYYTVTATTTDTATINSVNSVGYTTYTSGGILEYNQPVDLTGYTARMHVREKLESTSIITQLTTENGRILIDNVYKTVTLKISATDTAALNFTQAVYNLELINSDGIVTSLTTGNIQLLKEVTR